ncbi:MAG TPA: HAD family phosphatase [Cyclobacteriaceae bacterium]|nr:HAD family phosphatase [Cyclobacteriaceae bacterium]
MNRYEGFIFDLNGTMVNDMHYHETAWYDVFVNKLKAPLTLEQVRQQLYGKADEIFDRIFGAGRFGKDEIERITLEKEARYREEFLPHLKLIDGLDIVLGKAKSVGISLAIGTAAPVLNVEFVLDNLGLRHYFPIIIGPDDVAESKPHPEVFLKAAGQLGILPEHCIVFEDSPRGIEAAARAGMKAIAITSYHAADELKNKNVLFAIEDYRDARLDPLF